ncbi:Fic family protein [Salmonella enterica subsp. enterica serovar Kentucky]|nr:Fic family protein [Salmonella enterica subsp. enterica serovar Kentucky]
MAKYEGKDPYTDPETGVLRNRLGLKDEATLERTEATLAYLRSVELAREPVRGKFDLEHMKEIHKKLFGDVYEWAGQLRTVDISKGGTKFAHFGHIEGYAPTLTKQLARENHLRGLDPEEFSRRAGHYMGELNVLHPFREGNGRTLREFVGQLAREAGYHIEWSRIERQEMTRASIEAYRGDSRMMAELIRANLTDRDRERAAELARSIAGDKVQLERAEPGKTYEGRVIGQTERYIVQERADRAGEMVLHNRRAVSAEVEKLQGRHVEIRYPHGNVGLVRDREAGRGAEHDRQHQRQGPQHGDRER